MITKIISGGQTGADRGGLDAAIALDIPHGGWCPKDRRSESGPIPLVYDLTETKVSDYTDRTEKNILGSDGTIVFTNGSLTRGSSSTINLAQTHRKPCLYIDFSTTDHLTALTKCKDWIHKHNIAIINIAGSRESSSPGLQERVKDFLLLLLKDEK